jgi:hypothetical protein
VPRELSSASLVSSNRHALIIAVGTAGDCGGGRRLLCPGGGRAATGERPGSPPAAGARPITPSGLSGASSWQLAPGSPSDAEGPDGAGKGGRSQLCAAPAPAGAGGEVEEGGAGGCQPLVGSQSGLRQRPHAVTSSEGAAPPAPGAAPVEQQRQPQQPGQLPSKPPLISSEAAVGAAGRRSSHARRALALCATFAFSGLWHVFIWHHHRVGGTGLRWFAFFTLQARATVLALFLAAVGGAGPAAALG